MGNNLYDIMNISEAANMPKEAIVALLNATHREGIENVLSYMEQNGFYSSAASINFHNNFYGGLAKHSLEVFWEADELWLKEFLDRKDDVSQENIKLTALLHDICKMDKYPCFKGNKPISRRDISLKYHGKKSVDILATLGLVLSDEEKEAIRWHMGLQNS